MGEKRKTERTSVTTNARVETERPFASWRHSSRRSGREKNEREGEARSNPTETNDFAAHARKRERKGGKERRPSRTKKNDLTARERYLPKESVSKNYLHRNM